MNVDRGHDTSIRFDSRNPEWVWRLWKKAIDAAQHDWIRRVLLRTGASSSTFGDMRQGRHVAVWLEMFVEVLAEVRLEPRLAILDELAAPLGGAVIPRPGSGATAEAEVAGLHAAVLGGFAVLESRYAEGIADDNRLDQRERLRVVEALTEIEVRAGLLKQRLMNEKGRE